MSEHFCLKWNNHQTTLVSVFDKLLECESLVDCTLAADGKYMKAHKVVLSACSSYLEDILRNHEDKHPILIFNDISFNELKAMLEYMYRGEVNVSQEQLNTFLKAAEALKIKGLTDQGGGGGSSDGGGGQENLKRKMGAAQNRKTQSPVLGMTPVERPSSPKRRKPVRRQSRDENFPGDSNSCDTAPTPPPTQSQQVNSIAARIEEKVAKIKKESGISPGNAEPSSGGAAALSALGMLQPKTEFLEESGNVEDLTLEEEEEYGPNPGTSQGSFSSQDFNNWQLGDTTSDEVFLASQHDVNNSAGNSQGTSKLGEYILHPFKAGEKPRESDRAQVNLEDQCVLDKCLQKNTEIPVQCAFCVGMLNREDGEDDMGSTQHYCLRWNNYQSNMTSVFHHLLRTQAFVDVTLACNDQSLMAHKVVLSACSSYFQKLLLENPCKHPTIIMPQDVCFTDLKFIIEFVYKGEIDVSQAELQSLLKTADHLKIKGLCEVEDGKEGAEVTPLPPTPRKRTSTKQQRLGGKKHVFKSMLHNGIREEGIPECMEVGDEGGDEEEDDEDDEDNDDDEPKALPVVVVQHSPPAPSSDGSVMISPQQPTTATAAILHQQQSVVDGRDSHQIGCVGALREGEVAMGAEPSPPTATLVTTVHAPEATHRDIAVDSRDLADEDNKVKYETLRALDHSEHMKMESHITDRTVQTVSEEDDPTMHTMMITPELLGLIPSSQSDCSDVCSTSTVKSNYSTFCTGLNGTNNKSWTQEDMDLALEALRHQTMSLSKASATYGIPSTTLWQRAHRLGIDTPKKEGQTKSWTEHSLNTALEALRTGQISANKASKAYGIPSSTLYKIARREGIRLAAPFNAAPTAWVPEDLERALDAIRSGQCTVQRAAAEYGIPSGTLYGRCKREGIELSRNNPTPWSEEAMMDALEAVRIGQMSINQAAIHYNLPYSSLYGRFKRGKYENVGGSLEVVPPPPPQTQQQQSTPSQQPSSQTQEIEQNDLGNGQPPPSQQQQHSPTNSSGQQPQIMLVQYQQPLHVYQPATAT